MATEFPHPDFWKPPLGKVEKSVKIVSFRLLIEQKQLIPDVTAREPPVKVLANVLGCK